MLNRNTFSIHTIWDLLVIQKLLAALTLTDHTQRFDQAAFSQMGCGDKNEASQQCLLHNLSAKEENKCHQNPTSSSAGGMPTCSVQAD